VKTWRSHGSSRLSICSPRDAAALRSEAKRSDTAQELGECLLDVLDRTLTSLQPLIKHHSAGLDECDRIAQRRSVGVGGEGHDDGANPRGADDGDGCVRPWLHPKNNARALFEADVEEALRKRVSEFLRVSPTLRQAPTRRSLFVHVAASTVERKASEWGGAESKLERTGCDEKRRLHCQGSCEKITLSAEARSLVSGPLCRPTN
jgi:hypothetical protein